MQELSLLLPRCVWCSTVASRRYRTLRVLQFVCSRSDGAQQAAGHPTHARESDSKAHNTLSHPALGSCYLKEREQPRAHVVKVLIDGRPPHAPGG